MAQIDGTGQQDTANQNADALQAAFAQREVTPQGQPQGGSDVPSHQTSDPAVRRIGNSTVPSGSYRKTSCTVPPRIRCAANSSAPDGTTTSSPKCSLSSHHPKCDRPESLLDNAGDHPLNGGIGFSCTSFLLK